MSAELNAQLLPWKHAELEALLRDLIPLRTETAKVDYKQDLQVDTAEAKSEFLKDISAIANTYDDQTYRDHGFLVYGVAAGAIVGVSKNLPVADKLQNEMEQLLRTYLSPMPPIYVVEFDGNNGLRWGVVVIPPRHEKPYMFAKEFQCKDQSKTRFRGDWYVRRGATTDVGLPEDLARINLRQSETALAPVRESVRVLQVRLERMEEQQNAALLRLLTSRVDNTRADTATDADESLIVEGAATAAGLDLADRLQARLRTPTDRLARDLSDEFRSLADFVGGPSTGLPWAPQPGNVADNKAAIELLEAKMLVLLRALAIIALSDGKGQYTQPVISGLKLLAKTSAPSGVSYNRLGEGLRHYPLGVLLYAASICAASANRGDFLRAIYAASYRVSRTREYRITENLRYWYSAKELFNDAFQQNLCSPLNMRARQFLSDSIGGMIAGFTEPESFFRGEFLLALTGIDADIDDGNEPDRQAPWPGLYLYYTDCGDPIADLLSMPPTWLATLYSNDFEQILERFRVNAYRFAPPECSPHGLDFVDVAKVYSERRKPKVPAKPSDK